MKKIMMMLLIMSSLNVQAALKMNPASLTDEAPQECRKAIEISVMLMLLGSGQEPQREEFQAKVEEAWSDFPEMWRSLSAEDRQKMLAECIETGQSGYAVLKGLSGQ